MAMASAPEIDEALIVTPHMPKPEKSPGTTKRKVTPSSELSSQSKSFILSPYGTFSSERTVLRLGDSPLFELSMRLFPSGEAVINKRTPPKTTHTHPGSPESSLPGIQIPHLVISFFYSISGRIGSSPRILSYCTASFRTQKRCGLMAISWCFGSGPCRRKPWPITIAGVQPYFTIDPNDEGPFPPIKRSSKSPLSVSAEINATNLPPAKLTMHSSCVFDFFAKSEISITEVQYWNNFFIIVLENEDTDLAEVPCAIGRCNCFYLFEKEMGRPKFNKFRACRIRNLTGDAVDNSEYDILRPGFTETRVGGDC
ncbi:hypothetical protein N7532_004828 [Penicillium argentinense]|uniref:Uncharacterized protein n=1 Tax=Penicillium argentinense TaxID=1131581 RepID=A0A9W9FCV8_9EURO|nr:uncharacterized protein N7532_004828 [Penicillium argentinense]KAJ5097827.1 hypothetical protein N7532_004828 [Penicillium argentinense]